MKHTLIVSAGAAGLLALGVAVPAVASSGSSASPSSSTSSLTSSQLSSIEDFLADHPNLAQGLAGRAAVWAKFLAANPSIKAELDKVAGMPADQRRSALKTWLQANPDAKKALQEYRIGNKQTKLTQRQDRLKQRQQKLQNPATPAPSSSSSGSNSGLGDAAGSDSTNGLSA
jgi:hemophore-related protein